MRLVSFILSIYILALSIVPCSDGITHILDNADGQIEVSQSEHDYNHSDQSDLCTLFCSCSCCGSLTVAPRCYNVDYLKTLPPISYIFLYKFDYTSDYTEGVWHPPASC